MRKNTKRIVTSIAVTMATSVTLTGLGYAPAAAADGDGGADRAAAIVEAATGTADLAPTLTGSGIPAKTVIETGRGSVVVAAPEESTGAVVASGELGSFALELPSTERVLGVRAGAGTVVYPDAAKETDISVQHTLEGGTRTLLTLKNAEAPTTHRFNLTVPEGAELERTEAGGYEVLQEVQDGVIATVGIIEAPWAKDANGTAVETEYRLEDDQLVQVIDINENTEFPVVADPEWSWGWVTGKMYFSRGETRNMRDVNYALSFAGGSCLAIAWTGVGAAVCAALASNAFIVAVAATRYYEQGHCLKIKVALPAFVPERHKRGERNCK